MPGIRLGPAGRRVSGHCHQRLWPRCTGNCASHWRTGRTNRTPRTSTTAKWKCTATTRNDREVRSAAPPSWSVTGRSVCAASSPRRKGRRPDHRHESVRVPAGAGGRVRRDRHRRRGGRRPDQGADRRHRRGLGPGARRHSRVHAAGPALVPPRWQRRRPARGGRRRAGAVLLSGRPARRPRTRPRLLARPDRPRPARPDPTGQGLPPHLPLDQVAEGYRAMDERRAVKALLELRPRGRGGVTVRPG
ncbi:hypothetical protein SCANM63S_03224 [Streptomyces canarius]